MSPYAPSGFAFKLLFFLPVVQFSRSDFDLSAHLLAVVPLAECLYIISKPCAVVNMFFVFILEKK